MANMRFGFRTRLGLIRNDIEGVVGYVPLLDSFPSAAAAYSTRLLRLAYSGNCIRVRRSNDNAEQDIGFDLFGNLDESALTTFVGANNGFVTTFYDQSGNGRDATQTTAANQPRIVNSGVVDKMNNRPALIFDGSNDVLTVASSTATFNFLHNGTESAVVFVGNADTSGGLGYFGNNAGASANVGFQSGQDTTYAPYVFISRGSSGQIVAYAQSANNTITASTFMLYADIDADNSTAANRAKLYINNNASVDNTFTTVVTTANASFNFQIGAAGNNALVLDGSVQELVLYQTNQTTNRAGIQNHLNTYYAIY